MGSGLTMALDPEKLYALDFPEIRQRYGWRDSVIYALGLGFGLDPLDEGQLAFLDETKLLAVYSCILQNRDIL